MHYRQIARIFVMLVALALGTATVAFAATPSDNDTNRENGWAHFNVEDVRIGEVDIELVSTRAFFSCFEYRSDGEPPTHESDNPNTDIDDGLWEYICVNDSTENLTIPAAEYVEIRMVFGAENDERFDWTRVDVLPDAQTHEDCKDGSFGDFGFSNQGQCLRYVNSGHDARA